MDGHCAACRTERARTDCDACGFAFCGTHADPTDHRCPELDRAGAGADVAAGADTASSADDGPASRAGPAAIADGGWTVVASATPVSECARSAVADGRERLDGATRAGATAVTAPATRVRDVFSPREWGEDRTRRVALGVALLSLVAISALPVGGGL